MSQARTWLSDDSSANATPAKSRPPPSTSGPIGSSESAPELSRRPSGGVENAEGRGAMELSRCVALEPKAEKSKFVCLKGDMHPEQKHRGTEQNRTHPALVC